MLCVVQSDIPTISSGELDQWRDLSYPALCAVVLGKYIPTSVICADDLTSLLASAFSRFGIEEVVRLSPLPPVDDIDLKVLELFHGPTLAFKDLGMSVLCEVNNVSVKLSPYIRT